MSDRFYRRPIDAPYREPVPERRQPLIGLVLAAVSGGVATFVLMIVTGMVRI